MRRIQPGLKLIILAGILFLHSAGPRLFCGEEEPGISSADDTAVDETVLIENPPYPDNYPADCQEPPPGARAVVYRILFTQDLSTGMFERPVLDNADNDSHEDNWSGIQVYNRQLISSEEEYLEVFGHPSEGINWEEERIFVFQEFTSYKFHDLESTLSLSGIYQSEDTIYIGSTSTRHGPCQGIAQQMEWFSFEHRNLFILLPQNPARIMYYFCRVGGCPPGIP